MEDLTYFMWRGLRTQMSVEATLDAEIPNYIRWERFNKTNGCRGDGEVVDKMGYVIADVFEDANPTYVLGIEDSGIPLAQKTSMHIQKRITNHRVDFLVVKRSFDPPVNTHGIVVEGKSYKRNGPCYFTIPIFPKDSRVLMVDDTGAKGGTSPPCSAAVMMQDGVELIGLAVGFDKPFQRWEEKLAEVQKEYYPFPVWSTVRIEGINYEDGLNHGKGDIVLMEEAQARKIF